MGDEALAPEAYREAIHRWFVRRGLDACTADDLTQQVLLRLHGAIARGQTLTRAYLTAACHSVLNDYLRQRQREPACISLEECCACAVVERGYEAVETRLLLEQALAQLGMRERTIVELHYLEELPFAVIGERLGEPEERVKKACQRAIRKLQKWAQSGGGGVVDSCSSGNSRGKKGR